MEDSIYQHYLIEIRRYDLLTAEQEQSLSVRVQNGDDEAKSILIKSNLRLVASIAKKYSSNRIPLMDLIQEGNLGLMVAAQKFTCEFNTRFSTYAYSWILQYMLRFIRNKSDAITLPHRKSEQIRALRSAKTYLEQKNGKTPSLEDLASYLNMSNELVHSLYQYAQPVCSFDIECNDDCDNTIGDMIPDEVYQPEKQYLEQEKKECVRNLVAQLPKRERDVVAKRYCFSNVREARTLRELSRVMGVSSETVRQIELRAVKRLRTFINASEMKSIYKM